MTVGTEWMIDAEGCQPDLLRDSRIVRAVCDRIIKDLKLQVAGPELWHEFPPPGGITGLFLLTESHLACHTYPEDGIATFNLYCCRNRPEWDWNRELTRALDAQSVGIRRVLRGAKETAHANQSVGGRGGHER